MTIQKTLNEGKPDLTFFVVAGIMILTALLLLFSCTKSHAADTIWSYTPRG
jgi:hypothetical protein